MAHTTISISIHEGRTLKIFSLHLSCLTIAQVLVHLPVEAAEYITFTIKYAGIWIFIHQIFSRSLYKSGTLRTPPPPNMGYMFAHSLFHNWLPIYIAQEGKEPALPMSRFPHSESTFVRTALGEIFRTSYKHRDRRRTPTNIHDAMNATHAFRRILSLHTHLGRHDRYLGNSQCDHFCCCHGNSGLVSFCLWPASHSLFSDINSLTGVAQYWDVVA